MSTSSWNTQIQNNWSNNIVGIWLSHQCGSQSAIAENYYPITPPLQSVGLYPPTPFTIMTQSGAGDMWSISLLDSNNELYSTGYLIQCDGPNDSGDLLIQLIYSNGTTTVEFNWPTGSTSSLPLFIL